MPMRRAVSKVATLSDVEAWEAAMRRNRVDVRYLVRLDEPVERAGHCYWPVEVRADGKLWRRYLVTPDGKKVLNPEE